MHDNMDRVGRFVDRVGTFYDQLSLAENSVFLIEEDREYESVGDVRTAVVEYADRLESLPVVSIDVRGRVFRVFVKPMDTEAQIIGRLSAPNCSRVVKRFRDCILELESDSGSVDGKARTVQSFFRFTRDELDKVPEWGDGDVDTLSDLIEDFLMLKFYEKLFMDPLSDDHLQDEILVDRIEKMPADEVDSLPAVDCTDWDAELGGRRLPRLKLDLLVDKIKTSAEELSDADTILGRLIADIVKSKPRRLISNLRFIQRFRNHERLKGEAAYTMTMMVAVIQHIDQMVSKTPGQPALLYSLVANSTTSIATLSAGEAEEVPGGGSFVARQVTELNSMAASVFNTIGFVPRAIGAAVADTIRSRSDKQSAVQEGGDGEEKKRAALRAKILAYTTADDLTMDDVRGMFLDYQDMLREGRGGAK